MEIHLERMKNSPRKRGANGGQRRGAGRPVKKETIVLINLKEKIKNHGLEEVEWSDKNGKITRLSRVEILLHKLFELGEDGNTAAIQMYLDRTAGKVPQTVGEDADQPFHSLRSLISLAENLDGKPESN